jgi:putative hemolysin
MSPFPWGDVAIIAILVLLNGAFAMSELAIVSSRDPRLQAAEKRGSRGARLARQLASDPGRFLSTVQVGITLIGVLTGAYSGASLGGPVAERLQAWTGLDPENAENIGFALVIAVTTYFSLIVHPNASRSSWRCRCTGCRGSRRRSSGCSTTARR